MKNNKVYRFLTSIRFAVILMVIIVILCVIYTTIPQNGAMSVYTERYGSTVAGILTSLGFDHVLRSPWMYVSGILFALNLGLCTIRRFGFALKNKRNRLSAWGSPILHVGLCAVLLGAVLSLFVGRKLYYEIPVGETVEFRGGAGTFSMTAEEFKVEYYEDGITPKQYRTKLAIEKNGEVDEKEIYVNGPARYEGSTIIQQSYGWMMQATISSGTAEKTLRVKEGESVSLLGDEQGIYTIMMQFYPDYDENKGVDQTPGNDVTNPHMLWILNEGDEVAAYGILARGETQTIAEPLSITFDEYARYTGVQAKYDPGVPVIFAGFLLIFAGLVVRYLFGNRKKKEEV